MLLINRGERVFWVILVFLVLVKLYTLAFIYVALHLVVLEGDWQEGEHDEEDYATLYDIYVHEIEFRDFDLIDGYFFIGTKNRKILESDVFRRNNYPYL